MTYDLEAAQKAWDKYTALYDNELYEHVFEGHSLGRIESDAELGVIMGDCALIICGHPGMPQTRWIDLMMKMQRETLVTQLRVIRFLSSFISQAAA